MSYQGQTITTSVWQRGNARQLRASSASCGCAAEIEADAVCALLFTIFSIRRRGCQQQSPASSCHYMSPKRLAFAMRFAATQQVPRPTRRRCGFVFQMAWFAIVAIHMTKRFLLANVSPSSSASPATAPLSCRLLHLLLLLPVHSQLMCVCSGHEVQQVSSADIRAKK